jgi:hypothetical protein
MLLGAVAIVAAVVRDIRCLGQTQQQMLRLHVSPTGLLALSPERTKHLGAACWLLFNYWDICMSKLEKQLTRTCPESLAMEGSDEDEERRFAPATEELQKQGARRGQAGETQGRDCSNQASSLLPRLTSTRSNASPLRETLRWLKISNLSGRPGCYSSQTWTRPSGRILARSRASEGFPCWC